MKIAGDIMDKFIDKTHKAVTKAQYIAVDGASTATELRTTSFQIGTRTEEVFRKA